MPDDELSVIAKGRLCQSGLAWQSVGDIPLRVVAQHLPVFHFTAMLSLNGIFPAASS